MTHVTNIHDAKARLSELIKRALAGEEVVIAKAGEPMVRLTPLQPDLTPRQGGQLKGKIWIADNFDAFDEELDALFYSREAPPAPTTLYRYQADKPSPPGDAGKE
jgi:prevent-host-death family protein